jgi:5,10-methenyltetrahydromethanopterin hydrogenase
LRNAKIGKKDIGISMVFNPNSSNFPGTDVEEHDSNQLLKYLQHQAPEVLAQVARSVTPQVKQIISQNVQGLVGMLPSENFEIKITTDREDLAGLLASAMMTGYFLRQMEQRMEMELLLTSSHSIYADSSDQE